MDNLKETKHYLSNPCKVCGDERRYKSGRTCVTCAKRKAASWWKDNPNYRSPNYELLIRTEKYKATRKAWNKAHPKKMVEATKKYMKNNPERRAWNRRAKKQKVAAACPKWVDKKSLKEVYDKCPKGMEVDHIIPLAGKIVSGLHVPWNLQYLTPEDNKRKTNKYA